jgi:uncharacterized protein
MIDINAYRSKLTELCHTLSVRRLEIVGSAAREDFNKDTSDIDVIIEFNGNDKLFDRYFDLKKGLEEIFKRKVDVIQTGAINNPYLHKSLEKDRIAIYEA